ncbi:MAG: hypothetical protein WD077_00320 [Bacteroidia bacterium]
MKNSYINNPLDDKLREKLQEYEVAPPPEVWETLESRLNAQQPVGATKRYALLLLIPLLALLGTGIYFWQADPANETQDVTAMAKSAESASISSAQTQVEEAAHTGNEQAVETPGAGEINNSPANSATADNLASATTVSGPAQPSIPGSQDGNIADRNSAANNSTADKIPATENEELFNEILLSKMPSLMTVLFPAEMGELDEEYPEEKESVVKPRQYRPRLGWSVEASFTPAFSSRFLQESNVPGEEIPNQNQIQDHMLIEYRNEMEKTGFGYSFDLKIGKRLNETWILRSGISYIRMTEKVGKTEQFATPQMLSNDSMVVLNIEQNMRQGAASRNYTSDAYMTQTNEYVFIAVPVTLQYEKGFGLWRFYMGAGASVDYLIHARTEVLDNYSWPIDQNRRLSPLPRLNYSLILNAGLGFEVLPHLTLTGEPTYRVSLRSILPEGSSLQQYPYMLGFSTGVKYEF